MVLKNSCHCYVDIIDVYIFTIYLVFTNACNALYRWAFLVGEYELEVNIEYKLRIIASKHLFNL